MRTAREHSIYLDNQATTPIDKRVVKQMMPYFQHLYGNPSSHSKLGQISKLAIEEAREKVASLLHAQSSEIFFTSGATESINWGIKGLFETTPAGRRHIITTAIEHSAVLQTCRYLVNHFQAKLTIVNPGTNGIIDPKQIEACITDETYMVIMMHANNEIGTIQPIEAVGQLCADNGVLFMVDGAQSVGKLPYNLEQSSIDLLAASGHKLYGPKGVGFLWVRSSLQSKLSPLFHGGDQERAQRAGTENVASIVGLGEACAICQQVMSSETKRIYSLRQLLLQLISTKIPEVIVNGCLLNRLPGNLNLSFPGIVNKDLINCLLNQVVLSNGSACSALKSKHSYVLEALSVDREIIDSSIRIGIGRFTTKAEIKAAVLLLVEAIGKLRAAYEQF